MEIRIGDKVRFLNQIGEGKVVKIIDNKTVMVLDEDDFEVPSAIVNLVVIESDFNTESEDIVSTTIETTYEEVNEAVERTNKHYIAFVSKDATRSGSDIDCYIVNDTKEILFYTFYIEKKDGLEGVGAGNCNAGEKMILESFSANAMNDIKSICLHIISYKLKGEPENPFVFKMNINPVKFFKNSSYKSNDFFDVPAMVYNIEERNSFEYKLNELTERDEKRIISQKEKKSSHGFPVIKTKNEPIEVDLHINKLLDSVVGLSNRDILQYQLDKFHEVMEENCSRKGQVVVFIHGIGNGTLKQKIHWELDHKYKNCRYQDASFQKYGPGATMVVM